MFLGLFLDVNSVPEIPSLPQDLADSFIDGTLLPRLSHPHRKIPMQTISSQPFPFFLVKSDP